MRCLPVRRSSSTTSADAPRWGSGAPPPDHADAEHVETGPGLDHLCFRARSREDVDAVYSFLREIGADIVRAPEQGPWAPGYYSLSFRDPEGIRLELNHVPGKGLLVEGAAFDPAPEHPLSGG